MAQASSYIRRRGPLRKMGHIGPNMTPMVDVVLCILIFFMLGTTFAGSELFLTSTMPAIGKEGLGADAEKQKLPAVRVNLELKKSGAETVMVFGGSSVKIRQEGENAGVLELLK